MGIVHAETQVGVDIEVTFGEARDLLGVGQAATAPNAASPSACTATASPCVLAFVDIDPTHVRVYGRQKIGAEYGRLKGIRTLHPILSTISTEGAAPVIGPVRLRRGKSADVRGAASFVTEAIGTAREAGCTGTIIVRADSKFYSGKVVSAIRRQGAQYSIATGMNPGIRKAVTVSMRTPGPRSPTRTRSRTRTPGS